MDHISIIIVHFNTPKETRDCLESLVKINMPRIRLKIIVVDNGSKKVFNLPKNFTKNKVDLIRSESNLGFTGGNNLGISHAVKEYNSDYFMLLNSDTLVEPNFLIELLNTLKNNPEAGLVAPKIYFAPNYEFHKKSYLKTQRGRVLWYAGGSIDWLNLTAFHRGVDELDRGQFDTQSESDFATGCCLLFKRDVIEKAGILDKKYFLYFEDVDFSLKAKKKGFKILFEPKSIIWHLNAGSSGGSGSSLHQYYQTRNRLLFTFKHARKRIKLTALRLLFNLLFKGNNTERKAVIDLILQRYGKQRVY